MDRLSFALLIGYISAITGREFASSEIQNIDNITKPPLLPVNEEPKVSPDIVNALLSAMNNNQKIEAIKAYRCLTGSGLKESKDAIEKYWGNVTVS